VGADELQTQKARMMDLLKQYMQRSIASVADSHLQKEKSMEEVKKMFFVNQIMIFIAHATITHQVQL
jgi:flagellar biosynthesis regulator FlaF